MTNKTWFGKIGFRFQPVIQRPQAAILQQLKVYSACNISDGANKMYTMYPDIKPLGGSHKICGPAVTVELPMGDNLMLHKALSLVQPGDILVVDAHGCMDFSTCGGIMMRRMAKLGVQGIVVDGCVRDLEEFTGCGLPVFAKGLSPRGGGKAGPGQINFPICCGRLVVMPGDIILADENGIVCIPQADIDEVIQGVEAKLSKEKTALAEIAAGHLVKSDIDDILRLKNILREAK